jgi:hypothetical protein
MSRRVPTTRVPPRKSRFRVSSREDEGDKPYGAEADVFHDNDMYDQVVVAAFGGVSINLDKELKAQVHPFFLLVLAILLFILQVSILTFLKLDMDLAAEVKHEDENTLLLPAKLLMVTVLQLMLFKELIGALKMMIFAANPTSWTDIERIDSFTIKFRVPWLYFPFILAPISLLSATLKFTIAYIVCVDSLSLVLESRKITDAIFNSLAITFIADLDNKVWEVAQDVFHLEESRPNWRFCLWAKDTDHRENIRNDLPAWWVKALDSCSILHRGRGGRSLELMLTVFAMFIVYLRQIFLLLFALETNRLPVARDVCSMWRWENGEASKFKPVARFIALALQKILVVDVRPQVEDLELTELHNCAGDGEFGRMVLSDIRKMFFENEFLICSLMAIIFCILILPAVATHLLNDYCKDILYNNYKAEASTELNLELEDRKGYERVDGTKEEEVELLLQQVQELRAKIEKLQQRVDG